uniref:Uncharacterized protein n=1 Tax=Anguilla anguilla TaxID=7936 RepID=A0A0E9ULH0_ANGAN
MKNGEQLVKLAHHVF